MLSLISTRLNQVLKHTQISLSLSLSSLSLPPLRNPPVFLSGHSHLPPRLIPNDGTPVSVISPRSCQRSTFSLSKGSTLWSCRCPCQRAQREPGSFCLNRFRCRRLFLDPRNIPLLPHALLHTLTHSTHAQNVLGTKTKLE